MRGQKLSKIHFLILLSLLGFISPLQSQEYKFRTLGVEDGLSQITVRSRVYGLPHWMV